jgi:hypothetical protein
LGVLRKSLQRTRNGAFDVVCGWLPLTPLLASSRLNGCAQHGAKLSVMLDVPLATNDFAAC